ncbi:MAG: hypothetical protein WBN16_07435 [Lutimonas sp.]
MSLKNINPTHTKSWKSLEVHYQLVKDVPMKTFFQQDKERKEKFSASFEEIDLDFSKNRIDDKTLELLLNLAKEVDL